MEKLCRLSHKLRIDILRMFFHSKTGHLASALSCIEILTVLYFVECRDEDKIILSKGHGAAALYAILAHKGLIPYTELKTFYSKGSRLLALASNTIPGIEIPTGSLGQGICYATGIAKAYKLDQKEAFVYCVLGDGETQEGSVWEAAMFGGNHRLNNLIVILDYNRVQASNTIENIANVKPVREKWEAFGWQVYEIDGHDIEQIHETIALAKNNESEKPILIIANTHKGHGISFIEDQGNCHMRNPKGNEWKTVCDEFGISFEELSFP